MARDLKNLIPEYESGSKTGEDSVIKPAISAITESDASDPGTATRTKENPYDTGKPRRIVTRGKITHEPEG